MKKVQNIVEYKLLDELYHLDHNPRTISKERMNILVQSIKDNPDFFECRPIICSDRTGKLVIIAGNQRLRAAGIAGLSEVPVVTLHGLSEKKEREITIRDNVELGEWDMEALANEWDVDELVGWGVEDIKPYKEIVEDEPEPIDQENTYSIVGDIYQLGDHRVFCGSFEDDEKVRELFGNKKATCTFTDPPYNVAYEGKTKDKLTIQNDSSDDFQEFLDKALKCIAENNVEGGV